MSLKDVTSVRVAGVDFRVECIDLRDKKLLGYIDIEGQKVYVGTGNKPSVEVTTVLHEIILHLGSTHYLSHRQELKETQVEQLAKGMFQILKDNPLLLEYLYQSIGSIRGEVNAH